MKKLTTLLAGIALAAGAQAATVTFADSFGLATTNWTHLLSAQLFNPAQGTLNSATFTFTDDIAQSFKAENTGAVADTLTPQLGAQMLFRKLAVTLLTTTITGTGTAFDASACDTLPTAAQLLIDPTRTCGTTDFAGTGGTNFGGSLTANGVGSTILTGGALAALIGTGTLGSVGFDVRAVGTGSIASANGNLDSSISTQARYNLSLVYDYTPRAITVPEPGSMALFGVALAGLAVLRRKASKAA